MKNKKLIYLLIILFLFILSGIYVIIKHSPLEYSTSDAVTYFDEKGRYQLINSVNEDYAVYDAEEEKIISDFLLYYTQKKEKVYFITNPSRKTVAYAILDLTENNFAQFYDMEQFTDEEKIIFENKEDMIDLTKKRSGGLKSLFKLLPQKWRDW